MYPPSLVRSTHVCILHLFQCRRMYVSSTLSLSTHVCILHFFQCRRMYVSSISFNVDACMYPPSLSMSTLVCILHCFPLMQAYSIRMTRDWVATVCSSTGTITIAVKGVVPVINRDVSMAKVNDQLIVRLYVFQLSKGDNLCMSPPLIHIRASIVFERRTRHRAAVCSPTGRIDRKIVNVIEAIIRYVFIPLTAASHVSLLDSVTSVPANSIQILYQPPSLLLFCPPIRFHRIVVTL